MIVDYRKIVNEILDKLKEEAEGKNLCLAAVLVGNDPGLERFVALKEKAAKSIGVDFKLVQLAGNASQEEIEGVVRGLDEDNAVSGIFVELPLPAHLDSQKILNLVSLKKDADLLSEKAQEKFEAGDFNILPPAVQAIKIIFDEFKIKPEGLKVAIFGMGNLVGRPASVWFKKMGAEVFEIDEFTPNPEKFSEKADVIVAGVGKPGLIEARIIKKDVMILDFGYGTKEGKIKGDAADDVSGKAGLVTPVPGGVGALTIAGVLKNLISLNS